MNVYTFQKEIPEIFSDCCRVHWEVTWGQFHRAKQRILRSKIFLLNIKKTDYQRKYTDFYEGFTGNQQNLLSKLFCLPAL